MAVGAFYEAEARKAATAAVKDVESQTSAEVVIALRSASGHYRHVDYLVGFLLALSTLSALMFLPQSFAPVAFPVDVAIAFALGALVSSRWPGLRRLLSSPALRQRQVRAAARATFLDLGIGRLPRRWGLLVYVSLLERRVEVVADIGIPVPALGTEWKDAVGALDAALQPPDLERFLAALRALGPILGGALPHTDDDVNELPDEVDAA